MSNYEQLFERWLSGELSAKQRQDIEHQLSSDPIWRERILAARQVDFYASTDTPKAVPDWNRASTFEHETSSWWQWQGMPAVSMVFSCMALVLVIFKVEFTINDNGLIVSFGDGNTQQQEVIAKQVDKKLDDFTQQQQLLLANYSIEQLAKQQTSNLELASYILQTSRQERKEDMIDFINYINEQRESEQLEQRIQFRQLEDAIQYQAKNLSNNEPDLQPVSWTVEE